MKSPKEISVDQKLIALTTEIIELTEEKIHFRFLW